MANPPISIPPFSNVPAPGSPIRSDWAQQITHYVVDNFAVALPTVTQYASFRPSAATPATTASTLATWLTLSTVTVPTGATTAVVQVNINNALRVDETLACLYTLDVTLSGGSYSASGSGVVSFQVTNERNCVSFARELATTAGSKAVLIGAARSTGTGQMTATNISLATATVSFR